MSRADIVDKMYIGDGVYVGHDGYQIWLSVNSDNHWVVALEPTVMKNLIEYYNKRKNG